MRRLLLVIVLVTVALSGCMEKGPSEKEKSVGEIKALSIKSADNLSTYKLISSVNETLNFKTPETLNFKTLGITSTQQSINSMTSVDLTGLKAMANISTKNIVEIPGKAANISSSESIAYQIGNATYLKDKSGRWINIQNPAPIEELWSKGKNNQAKTLAELINKSQVEIVGSEKIGGEDAYKLKVIPGSDDYKNLYNTSLGIAAQLTQYPLFMPSINSTEVNKTSKIENFAWISKDTYLPMKAQSSTSFNMTPIIVAAKDAKSGQMVRLNQSVPLREVSVDIKTMDQYYDFNKPVEITPPEEALRAAPISPTQIQLVPNA